MTDEIHRLMLLWAAYVMGYALIGAGVMSWLDMPERWDGRLLQWAKECGGGTLLAWPVIAVVCFYLMFKARTDR